MLARRRTAAPEEKDFAFTAKRKDSGKDNAAVIILPLRRRFRSVKNKNIYGIRKINCNKEKETVLTTSSTPTTFLSHFQLVAALHTQ
jgi:hypothetical protein